MFALVCGLLAIVLAAEFHFREDYALVPLSFWMAGSLLWFALVALSAFLVGPRASKTPRESMGPAAARSWNRVEGRV